MRWGRLIVSWHQPCNRHQRKQNPTVYLLRSCNCFNCAPFDFGGKGVQKDYCPLVISHASTKTRQFLVGVSVQNLYLTMRVFQSYPVKGYRTGSVLLNENQLVKRFLIYLQCQASRSHMDFLKVIVIIGHIAEFRTPGTRSSKGVYINQFEWPILECSRIGIQVPSENPSFSCVQGPRKRISVIYLLNHWHFTP